MIKQEQLYKRKANCCGCEICSMVCKHNVIKMRPDKSGFLYPVVENQEICVGCNQCVSVCPEKKSYRPSQIILSGYGGFLKDDNEIVRSASGGLSYAIGHKFISEGGVVYGVRYSDDFYYAHYDRAETLSELERFRTSKYIQAKKSNVYERVKTDLTDDKKTLFVGLPCEVAALYNYLKKDYKNLYTISLLCHGTTSPLVQKQICTQLEITEKQKIVGFSVRHKVKGWKPYYIKAEFDKGSSYLEQFIKTDYELAFKYLKRPSCSSCVFKLSNKQFGFKADMIIGDYHGAQKGQPFFNIWGSSKFYVLSEKGCLMKQWAEEQMKITPISIDSIYTGAPVMNTPTRKLAFSNLFRRIFEREGLCVAANNQIILFASKWLQPLSKKAHSTIRRVQIKLFKRIILW